MQDESEKKIVKNQYWVVEVGMAGRSEESGIKKDICYSYFNIIHKMCIRLA